MTERIHSLATEGCRSTNARLLEGAPVVKKQLSWCRKHNKSRHGVRPTLAVIYLDTGDSADEYLFVKRLVAAKAGVSYAEHKLSPDAEMDEVLDKILDLNEDDHTHGILIQRPVPEHLWTEKLMHAITPAKHVEEFTREKANNIAVDALIRLLDHYQLEKMLSLNVILLGGLNIITPEFKEQLQRRYRQVTLMQTLDGNASVLGSEHDTVIITELNRGHIITPDILGPAVKLIVDLGFDPETKEGDLDPDVLDGNNGLLIVPTPGGVLPVLLWTMMERTIRARDWLEEDWRRREIPCLVLPSCSVM